MIDGFGHKVALDGGMMVVGVNNVKFSGACLVYELDSDSNSWKYNNIILTPSDPHEYDDFGRLSVDIHNGTVFVGSYNYQRGGRIGIVYVYTNSTSTTTTSTTTTPTTAAVTTTTTTTIPSKTATPSVSSKVMWSYGTFLGSVGLCTFFIHLLLT